MGGKPAPKAVLAIDFETANRRPDSACALAAVLLRDGEVAEKTYSLMRPYSEGFCFSGLHGITAADVADKPHFDGLWKGTFEPLWASAELLIAHNIAFDLNVLFACSRRGGMVPAPRPYACTVQLSREAWPELPNHKLNTVCSALGVGLHHHDALSDALGCASIYERAIGRNAFVFARDKPGWTTLALPEVPSQHDHKPREHRVRHVAAQQWSPPKQPITQAEPSFWRKMWDRLFG